MLLLHRLSPRDLVRRGAQQNQEDAVLPASEG